MKKEDLVKLLCMQIAQAGFSGTVILVDKNAEDPDFVTGSALYAESGEGERILESLLMLGQILTDLGADNSEKVMAYAQKLMAEKEAESIQRHVGHPAVH